MAAPPPATACGQAILQACQQSGFTPTTRYVTADIAAQLALARAGLATALVPRTAIDPAMPESVRPPSRTIRSCVCCSPRRVTPRPRTRRPRPSSRHCGRRRARGPRRFRTGRRAAGGSGARTA
ncbi:LysR substrate-binding domain-containing protein [Streptomyces sp. 62]|uniref:LysR substrate-binding domain-containing protein n=1 Tax=Streptomyces sp. NPDC013171 TaxID=3364863 RepID=UPI000E274458